MTIKKASHIIFLLFTFALIQNVNAQNTDQNTDNDKVQSLGEILNEPSEHDDDGKALTSEIMANRYYESCISKKNLVFKKEELKILCGCNSAKMSELLTVDEFKLLYKDTKAGKDARGKMLAYAYAPCMEHVIESKVLRDCRKSKILKNIIIGKKAICKCTADEFKKFVNKNGVFIIMSALHNNPMTLSPLEDFYLGSNYHAQRDNFAMNCRFNFQYKKDNR